MEYVDGGELFHFVDERKGLMEDETVYIFRQIVSALLYCHRLLICHRDLKPENILLNQKDLSVKLIDFGMAALQPEGRLLSTPCGSPHYAAPEVVSSRPYDGTQADVWSCGVILYVMLTGTTPYNYSANGDIRELFRDIAKARYWMPPDLSLEAKDLIKRIFVPDPKRRITMDGIWDHPLLHKYDKRFGFHGQAGTKEAAIGPIPTITDFKITRIQDINREILRNMRTLWHSESEQTLIAKLLSNEINQEKLFYAALVRHREENLENYAGPDDMGYSNSDYHHNQTPITSGAPPVPPVQAPRSQSQYSILNDEHLRARDTSVEPVPSISSYDPYRASKNPIVESRGEYVNVTIQRNGTNDTRRVAVERSLRHGNKLRLESLKQGNRRVSTHSSSSLARSAASRSSVRRSQASKKSLTSSVWPSSPPVIAKMRPSDRHKRGVSFGHARRSSTVSAQASQSTDKTPPTPSIPSTHHAKRNLLSSDSAQPNSSPSANPGPVIRSRKERAANLITPRIKVRRSVTPTQDMRNDIRKHSTELEKACEEAFFRSSVGSSLTAKSTFSESAGPFDSPPSSVSPPPRNFAKAAQRQQPVLPRLLPDLPNDTPNTYLTKTLKETREKLAAYKADGDNNTAKFDEVMKMLENIMPSGARASFDKRSASAPGNKTVLPIISEEGNSRTCKDVHGVWQRSATDPTVKEKGLDVKTIRVVPQSPSGTVPPLNVRKRSDGSGTSSSESRSQAGVKASTENARHNRQSDHLGGLAVIDEDSTLPSIASPAPAAVRKKRSAWFGLNKKAAAQSDKVERGTTPEPFAQADDTQDSRLLASQDKRRADKKQSQEPISSAQAKNVTTEKKGFGRGKGGFGKWFGRSNGEKQGEVDGSGKSSALPLKTELIVVTEDPSRPDQSLDSLFSRASPVPSTDESPPAGPERSWFARFFHVKPASKVICFSIPRGRARQELMLLLQEWKRHGVHDIEYSREHNTITARVDKQNALDIKPVTFRIELFVVLEHGRKVGLSIARFVQVKGAASGFRRVIEVVDGVMRGRGWLVEDEEKWRALCEVVGG